MISPVTSPAPSPVSSPAPIAQTPHAIGEPYPLKRNYYTRVVPAIFFLLVLLSGLLWFAFDQVTQHIYLEQAQIRSEVIVDVLQDGSPDAWNAFITGKATPEHLDELGIAFNEQVERQKLISLKVYDLTGTVIYDINPGNIGKVETAPSLRQVILSDQPALVRKTAGDGTLAYEIYIPYLDVDGNLRAIFEVYEEVGYLDTLLLETALPAIAVPVALQIVLMLGLGVLVRRAQGDIDQRTAAIGQLSRRLETFVSSSAIKAARNAHDMDTIPSLKMTCTLFHSDVRDFTSFAEDNPPERVVFFLNDLMTIQVKIVSEFGGDVDKMIGDALLVRFEGKDAERRAIDAAKAILDAVRRASLARGLGIGIYTGQVISGAIGPKSRRDFTVIGDSVNMCARLCSQAGAGEIVVDAATVAAAQNTGPSTGQNTDQDNDFQAAESLNVKGHNEPLIVQRWNVGALGQKS
ncbi:MAG: adenylate/guanylate cyclase domain-containing protein [Rhodospirillales bacterium]|nr:adenylate/guanylate cyclase domain-containing protein [Rhodospirillales bacterium]